MAFREKLVEKLVALLGERLLSKVTSRKFIAAVLTLAAAVVAGQLGYLDAVVALLRELLS